MKFTFMEASQRRRPSLASTAHFTFISSARVLSNSVTVRVKDMRATTRSGDKRDFLETQLQPGAPGWDVPALGDLSRADGHALRR